MIDTTFENILLKQLTHNGEFFNKVIPILEQEYFYNIGNQEVFKLLKNHFIEYRESPSLTQLVAQVKNVSNKEIRGEIVNSLQAISKVDIIDNIDFLCNESLSWVKDSLYYKALQIGSDGLMKKDEEMKAQAQEIMDKRAKISIDSDLGLDFDDLDEMIKYYSERNVGIRTQHQELNKRLGPGFLPKTLSVILSQAGAGKSLLISDLISGMVQKNKNILLVSLEMSDKEIMKRVHANTLDLPINSLSDLSKNQNELSHLNRDILTKESVISAYNKAKLSGNCGKLYIKDFPAGLFSPLMLEQLVENFKIEKNIDFDIIFIDYIGIMKSDILSPSAGLYSYIKSVTEEIRAVAKKLNLPIISASQLNRAGFNQTSDVDNSNVSDSIGTVMTADFMLFLLQDEEMKERKEIVCKVTKNRFTGRTDTWMMGVDYEKMRFKDCPIQSETADFENLDILVEKQENAEKFAETEIKNIISDDIKKLKDPFKNELSEEYEKLGL